MKCLILAGGFATRLYPLTLKMPKALLEFKGEPNINHLINKVPGHIDILIAVNKKFESAFLNWKETVNRNVKICVEEAVEEQQKKGAITAVDYWIKQENIKENLIVIAADNYFEFNFGDFLAHFNSKSALVAVYDVGSKEKACELGKVCQVGLVNMENEKIVKLDEKPPEPTSSIIATGIYVLPARIFPILSRYCEQSKRDNLGSFINYLLNFEEVHGYVFNGIWVDIGDELSRKF